MGRHAGLDEGLDLLQRVFGPSSADLENGILEPRAESSRDLKDENFAHLKNKKRVQGVSSPN